jgi:hypothetical protein
MKSQANKIEKQRFFALAKRLRTAADKSELRRIKRELARLTFGH